MLVIQVKVNGSDANPLYKYLKSSKGGYFGDGIKWNFTKFLVDKDGTVVDRYAPTTSPLSIEVKFVNYYMMIMIGINKILKSSLCCLTYILQSLQKDIKKLLEKGSKY